MTHAPAPAHRSPDAGAPDPGASSYARRALAAVGIAAGVGALLFLLWQTLEALLLLFGGLLFGLFLAALADWISAHTPLPRVAALAAVVTLLVGLLALAVWLAGPAVVAQGDALQEQLPRALERLRERVDQSRLGHQALERLPSTPAALMDQRNLFSRVTGVFSTVLGALANLFVVVLFGLFVAAQPATLLDGVVRLVAPARRARVRGALVEAGSALRKWLLAKVLRIGFIGVATYLVLRWLGVPLAFLLALIAAPLNFVPNFGPVIAAVPAVLLALLDGPTTALWVALLYVSIQFVEGNVLDPILTKTVVAIPPALTFGTQVVLGILVGPVGLAVATPLVAALVVLVRRLYIEDVLGDPDRPVEA